MTFEAICATVSLMPPNLTASYYVLVEIVEAIQLHDEKRRTLLNERDLAITRAKAEGTSTKQIRQVTNLTPQQIHNIVRDKTMGEMQRHEMEDFISWKTRDMNAEEARAWRAEHEAALDS